MGTLRLNGSSSGYIEISAPAAAGSTTITLPATSGGNFLVTDSSGNLNVDSGTLYVDATNDRVGLGTSSPSQKLEIADGYLRIGTDKGIKFDTSNSANDSELSIDSSGVISFKNSAGTSTVSITNAGNVGIGTTSPTAPLEIVATTGQPILKASASTGTNSCYSQFSNTAGALIVGRDNSSGGVLGGGAYASHIYSQGAYPLVFSTDSTQRAQIDSSGRLLVGTSSARTNIAGATQGVLIEGTSSTNSQNRFITHVFGANNNEAPYLGLAKTRSTSIGGNTIVQNGDELGGIYFHGADGSDLRQAAYIAVFSDGTPGAADMPGRIVFATTGDGNFSPTERMRISNTGRINMPDVYGTAIGGTTRDLYIENTGQLGYLTSTAKTKTNIQDLTDVDWIYDLNVKSFNYKLRNEKGDLIEQANPETEYGLIAEEVEAVAPELCFYNETENGLELEGVTYRKLIAPMLKALQQAHAKIEALEAEVAALKGA